MGPIYQPLHGQAGGRSSRWADNPEACGIRCVVGVTLALLFVCAVLPLICPGFTRQQNANQVESKSLIIPLVTTTTATTSTSTARPTTTPAPTEAPTPAPPSSAASAARGAAGAGTTSSTAAAETSTTVAETTTAGSETTTALEETTVTTTTRTTDTTSRTSTATSETSTTVTSTTGTSSTTATLTTGTTTTQTTPPSAEQLARLKCEEEAKDPAQLRFPLSFECDAAEGRCPRGWTCKGLASPCGADSPSGMCGGNAPREMDGKQYMAVGGSPDKASLAASPIFILPDGTHHVVAKLGGDAGTYAGLSVHMASNGHRICSAKVDAQALRGAPLASVRCGGLLLHGSQGVYLLLRTSKKGEHAKLLVDDIRFMDEDDKDIKSALVIPGVKHKFPNLEEEGSAHRHQSPSDWIVPPAHCCDGERPTIATYAGKDKMSYIDGAVMLGLSLQWHVPEFPRLCLVITSMSQENKDHLTAAGWTLIDVEEWHPHQDHFANDYWWMVYNKIDVFRVKVNKLLWMDSDMYVWDDSLREVLEKTELPEKHIAMVKDCAAKNFNSGLMLLKPDVEVYRRLRHGMVAHRGWDGLDQPLINKEYTGRIEELAPKFNTHGIAKTCEGVVVAHYTGRNKPTYAKVANLRRVSMGYKHVPYSLRCPRLYEDYFCAMKNARNYLSAKLQAALREAGKGQTCMS